MILATVREWDDEEGWGVLDSPETPGGCWAHLSAVEGEGFRSLAAGEKVTLEWEAAEQDGFQYRAVRVVVGD
ncbi:cold shock domain-containing protein [Streptomyces sp. NRRL S-646]|uniref:cold shock domain-containing protein n=1 Tax=Streptomyces sp. NRRL S-646 TaxID=1463917 RepID=UPI0004C76126|nr:cold shock domain-containing protein [Streptomyces sp. NRRL S-646]